MNTFTRIALLSLLPTFLTAQTQISGTINHYAKVNDIDPCLAVLTVNDADGFLSGSSVLILQMKGASINSSNSGSFGDIDELGGAGLYEKNEVLSVWANQIFLKYELKNAYDPSNAVQVVTLPNFSNAEVTGTLLAKPWDGESGGVIALEANSLTLNADLDASGTGFRGAQTAVVNSDCNVLTNADKFHYNITDWRGSPKGEGVAFPVQGKEHGRGAQANGGGGGNDHNSGGGGGGNATAGGIGGKQNVGGFGCDGEYAGRGGKSLPDEQDRLFLGGGGGAGHVDNAGAGSAGANGGGIIFLNVNTIVANGHSIISNGLQPLFAGGDGAGGGGAGGTVLLKAGAIEGILNVVAKGGDGGNVGNSVDRCNGAGGGGGGGRVITNQGSLANIDLQGGVPGVNSIQSGQCNTPSNGAQAGQDGIQTNLPGIPTANQEIVPIEVVEQPNEALGCVGVQLEISFQVAGNYLDYQWQINDGTGWEDVPSSAGYAGATSPFLTIFSPAPAMDGFEYRCVVTSGCLTAPLESDAVELELVGLTQADFDAVSLGNGSYQFQGNAENATSYFWNFGDGSTSTEENPVHTYADFGDYTVELVATGPCDEATSSQEISVNVAPTAAFDFSNTGSCAPQIVFFENQSSSNTNEFEWHFPGGNPSTSTDESPVVEYAFAGLYDVVLIAQNSQGADTVTVQQAIEVGGLPSVDFGVNVSDLVVDFSNLSLNASMGYLWDFGDGSTSAEPNPVHVYASQAIYEVTLTAYNACGEQSVTLPVPTGNLPLAGFTANTNLGCSPLVVQFQNQSSGANLTGFQWEFPGGTPSTSTEENPTVTYTTPGSFAVALTATNSLGSHVLEQSNIVQVQASPEAIFSYAVDGLTVTFNNQSENATFFNWDFDDGNESQVLNPVHTYDAPGVYNVSLTTANSSCGSAIAQTVYLAPSATAEEADQQHLLIFPNPTSSEFTIYFKNEKYSNGQIRLMGATGEVLQVVDIQGDVLKFDASRYAPGVYFIEVKGLGGNVSVHKLVKI